MGSAAPVNLHPPSSHTSTQLWLPLPSDQSGTPTNRAGTPTARQASMSSTLRPVHEAMPASIDSSPDWSALGRCVEYLTPTEGKTFWFRSTAASPGVEACSTKPPNRSRKSARQSSRRSLIVA